MGEDLLKRNNKIWDTLYVEHEEGPLGITYPTEALIVFVSNMNKTRKIEDYFDDLGAEKSKKLVGKKINALEIGFGTTANLEFLKSRGWEVSGWEVSQEACNRASTYFLEKNIDIKIDYWSGKNFPAVTKKFDFVVALQSIYYNYEIVTFLVRLREVLADDGRVFFSFFSFEHSYANWLKPLDGFEQVFEFTNEHPNQRLHGSILFVPRDQENLIEVFTLAGYRRIEVFRTESNVSPLNEIWWYVSAVI